MTRQKITLGEMRSSGVRGLLVYCSDYMCSHWSAISADRWIKSACVACSDAEMRLWASDMEFGPGSLIRLHLDWADDDVANWHNFAKSLPLPSRRARGVIELYLSFRLPNETTH